MPFYQKDKSKVKMVALMPPNVNNIIWYSPIQENNKPTDVIINGMLTRFKKKKEVNSVQVYQFYENGQLYHEIKRP